MGQPRNPERNARIIELRKSGLWPREIARQMGVTHNVVIGVCNRAGLTDFGAGSMMVPRGETHRQAKLTEAQVQEIRATYIPRDRQFSAVALALRFGVDRNTIRNAFHGATWRHLAQPSSPYPHDKAPAERGV